MLVCSKSHTNPCLGSRWAQGTKGAARRGRGLARKFRAPRHGRRYFHPTHNPTRHHVVILETGPKRRHPLLCLQAVDAQKRQSAKSCEGLYTEMEMDAEDALRLRKVLRAFLVDFVGGALGVAVTVLSMKMLRDAMMPRNMKEMLDGGKGNDKAVTDGILARLLKSGIHPANLRRLSDAEKALLSHIVFPEAIASGFEDVGGLDVVKKGLMESVIGPLIAQRLFLHDDDSVEGPDDAEVRANAPSKARAMIQPPKGVLLYGPPGTGKTMLAKAIAKECGVRFINISPSALLSKWVGETSQMVRALFALATRLNPCIIFIDEVDALFRERTSGDHEVYRDMKAEFMQLWDGISTSSTAHVMVLGATNRPWELDAAIQRRMPRAFKVDLPNVQQRTGILRAVLKGSRLEPDFDFQCVAAATEAFSGSDLKELCRMAMLIPLKEAFGLKSADAASGLCESDDRDEIDVASVRGRSPHSAGELRALCTKDVQEALKNFERTQDVAKTYRQHAIVNSSVFS
ncbi:Protein MSP1 [Porphyridium purpureum]|uniref:Protein MSP1 n=1 Tax=Porphyridium purpureum TaxID=35688 RepID=A0A5J4Z5A4_PORPP|nr:Protein MSP1 [Porphyridium purpureum]|eukprot:POR0391..scf295_1